MFTILSPSVRDAKEICLIFFYFLVPAITIAGSTVITSIVGTAGLVALPTMAAGTLAPCVMSTSIAAQPIMTSTALLAGELWLK